MMMKTDRECDESFLLLLLFLQEHIFLLLFSKNQWLFVCRKRRTRKQEETKETLQSANVKNMRISEVWEADSAVVIVVNSCWWRIEARVHRSAAQRRLTALGSVDIQLTSLSLSLSLCCGSQFSLASLLPALPKRGPLISHTWHSWPLL